MASSPSTLPVAPPKDPNHHMRFHAPHRFFGFSNLIILKLFEILRFITTTGKKTYVRHIHKNIHNFAA